MYFRDESHILYVNGSCQDDSPLRLLMQDFINPKPSSMYYK